MLAPARLSEEFKSWNRRWHAPLGRRRTPWWIPLPGALEARLRGPFGFQENNSTRRFEYPFAYYEIESHGCALTVVEVGGALSGLQFVLAASGHRVTNIDPGLKHAAAAQVHQRLCRAFRSPVRLLPTTLDQAGIADASVDALLAISVIEHLAEDDLRSLGREVGRILKPTGVAVLTIDLFLDLKPFCRRETNQWGRNIDVARFLREARLELVRGEPHELFGFPEFDAEQVIAKLGSYMIGTYPALAQCAVARRQPK
jgi:SAM-dependent methyltransferase